MKIAYVSDILSIHDYRFLYKLSQSKHKVSLITYHDRAKLPSRIRNLPNLQIIHLQIPSKWKLEQYCRFGALKQIMTHFLSRTYLRASRIGGPLTRKPFEKWLTIDRRILFLLAAYSFRSYQSMPHFIETLRQINPDVVHAGWVQSSGLLTAISNFHPFLLMPWGSDILLTPDSSMDDLTMARFALEKADMITCDCETVKRRIVEIADYPKEKIMVIPWGIDLDLFNPGANRSDIRDRLNWKDKQVLITTRILSPVHGNQLFLQALPMVIANNPNARALIVGTGPMEDELRLMANKLGISEYVYFAGSVQNEELPGYLNSADIYVTSSLSDGTSLSLLEAMACGLPVIAPDLPSYLEWIEDGVNGFIAPVSNPKIFADKLLTLLKNDDLARKMGERNLILAHKNANWDRNFDKIDSMYSQLASVNLEQPISNGNVCIE